MNETALRTINTRLIHSVNDSNTSDPIGDEWPMFRGALNHTGVAKTTPVQRTGPLWIYATGDSVFSSPAIISGRVYIGSDDHNVYCLDAATGSFIWSYTTGERVKSSPAIAGGHVYVGSSDGKFYCLDDKTGRLIWNYSFGLGEFYSSPAIVGEHVYAVACGYPDSKIYCLNTSTGTLIWSYTIGTYIYSSPAVAGGRMYVGSYDGKMYCLNATTGASVWNYITGGGIFSSPAVASGRVYVGSANHKVFCLDATTGALVWSYTTGDCVFSSPAVASGNVYVGSYDDKVYCLNAITGASVWKYTTNGLVPSSPAIAGGYVYVGGDDDKLHCLNTTTGASVWNYSTGGYVESSPAITGGNVYVGSNDYRIYCFPMVCTNGHTIISPPYAPQCLRAMARDSQVVLNWSEVANDGGSAITGYNVYQGTTSGGEMLLATLGNMTTYTSTGLTNGQIYYYQVSAVNMLGEGARSNEANTMPLTVPTAPQNLTDQQILIAAFSFSPSTATANQSIQFHDFSQDEHGTIISWNWQFGDSCSENGTSNPVHIYTIAGTFTVILDVYDDQGRHNTTMQYITIGPASTSPSTEPSTSFKKVPVLAVMVCFTLMIPFFGIVAATKKRYARINNRIDKFLDNRRQVAIKNMSKSAFTSDARLDLLLAEARRTQYRWLPNRDLELRTREYRRATFKPEILERAAFGDLVEAARLAIARDDFPEASKTAGLMRAFLNNVIPRGIFTVYFKKEAAEAVDKLVQQAGAHLDACRGQLDAPALEQVKEIMEFLQQLGTVIPGPLDGTLFDVLVSMHARKVSIP